MARPRVFLSSTFYDLRNIRADLEDFMRSLSYEPVLHERGLVPYGPTEELEKYCYDEISNCDILVSIVGNRFGSESRRETGASISQVEHAVAHKAGKQIYVFVDKSVDNEFALYLKNIENKKTIKWNSVDDYRIFEFLEKIRSLQFNNAICPFEYASDIKAYLKDQWAGLFQRMLRDQERKREGLLVSELASSIQAVSELIQLVQSTSKQQSQALQEVLLSNHPLFDALKRTNKISYRLYFKSKSEIHAWLHARGFIEIDEDDDFGDDYFDWYRSIVMRDGSRRRINLGLSRVLFEKNGDLKRMLPADWKDEYIRYSEVDVVKKKIDDDDIPF